MLFPVDNYNTTWEGKSRGGRTIPVRVRIPSCVKETIRQVAQEKGMPLSQLIRLALFSRFHIDIPNPDEAAKERVTFRLSYGNWLALKAYSLSWGFPIWKAFLILLTHPYTVHDRPQKSDVRQVSYECPTDKEKKKKRSHVCTKVGLSKTGDQVKPANNLAFRLWNDYGVSLWVANDLVRNFPASEIEAAIELRERRNGSIYNPAGFIVHLLKNGYAQRYLEHKVRKTDPDIRAEEVKRVLKERGIKILDYGGVDYRIVDKDGRLWRPIDPADLESTLRLAWRLGLLSEGLNQGETEESEKAPLTKTNQTPSLWAEGKEEENLLNGEEEMEDEGETSVGLEDETNDEEIEPPVCCLCGRKEGESHPALQSYAFNMFILISNLSEPFRRQVGLGEFGVICRGCYTKWLRLISLFRVKIPSPPKFEEDG
jgi:hypothetical protein